MPLVSMHQARTGCLSRSAGSSRRAVVCASSTCRPQQHTALQAAATSRRDALLQASLITSWMLAGPALAICADEDTAEAAGECRAAELAKDRTGDYSKISVGAKKNLAPNVPVGDLNSEYVTSTRDLATKIDRYLTMDVYDRARQPLIKALKQDGSTWVSKYARGGSARSQSARNMYIAVDAIQGYLASNGLAPFPASKARVIKETLSKSLAFLDEGR